MKTTLALLAVLLVACSSSSSSPPPSSPSPQNDPNAAALAKMNAELAEQQRQGIEQQRQLQAAHDATIAAEEKRKRDAAAALERKCAGDRHERTERLKFTMADRLNAEARLFTHAKAIRASCKIVSRPTGAATVSRQGNGFRVAPELAADVRCSSLPKGATKEDAYVVLWRDANGIDGPEGPILQREDFTADDVECTELDKAAGFDGDATFEGLRR